MRRPWDVALYTLAMPAIFANAMTGQTGAWIAALFAGGLMAVERRPIAGGAILGLLIAKPQMAILVPVALLSGRQWTAFVSFCSVAFLLIGASAACFGANVWWEFARQVALLRSYVLEDGTGFWHLFTSVFVTVRHIPAPVSLAYAVQGAVAVIVSGLVISAWRSSAPQNNKNAVLVIGVFLVTPYVMVYDLVVTTLVPLWLVANLPAGDGWRRACLFAFVPLILSPLVTPAFAQVTGFGIGCLLLVPAFGLAVHFCARGARAASECPR